MKICVFSNSHGASLIDAIRDNKDRWRKVEFKFYALPGARLNHFKLDVEQRAFVAHQEHIKEMVELSTGGESSAKVDDFDAFFIYALGFRLPRLDQRISIAVQKAAIRDAFTTSNAALKLDELRVVTDKPVFVSSAPLPTRFDQVIEGVNQFIARPIPFEELSSLVTQVLDDLPITIVPQPAETVQADLITMQEFSTGSRRMRMSEAAHSETDVKHMNSAFGTKVLDRLIGALTNG